MHSLLPPPNPAACVFSQLFFLSACCYWTTFFCGGFGVVGFFTDAWLLEFGSRTARVDAAYTAVNLGVYRFCFWLRVNLSPKSAISSCNRYFSWVDKLWGSIYLVSEQTAAATPSDSLLTSSFLLLSRFLSFIALDEIVNTGFGFSTGTRYCYCDLWVNECLFSRFFAFFDLSTSFYFFINLVLGYGPFLPIVSAAIELYSQLISLLSLSSSLLLEHEFEFYFDCELACFLFKASLWFFWLSLELSYSLSLYSLEEEEEFKTED